ncbi:MAG: hypothetical protein JNL83_35395 [Myxococcales bacterium]|nr:hypothetical protein [Myxococcales bacterium]
MKRALVLVLALTAAASAAPVPLVTPPAGWVPDPEQAAQLAQKVAALKHFGGGGKLTVAADAHVPKTPGVALFVTRISAEQLAITRELAAREVIDDLKNSAGKPYDWRVLPASSAKAIVARAEWTDAGAATQTVGMVVIAASEARFVAVRGECFSADKADGAAVNACVQALASLDPGVPVAERIAFEPAPEGSPPAAEPTPPSKSDTAPRLTDGQDVQMAPIRVAPERQEADRRPVYLGGAIVVIAALSWWNRRRREKFEREESPDRAGDADGADDADDLAAAARGDKPKDDA